MPGQYTLFSLFWDSAIALLLVFLSPCSVRSRVLLCSIGWSRTCHSYPFPLECSYCRYVLGHLLVTVKCPGVHVMLEDSLQDLDPSFHLGFETGFLLFCFHIVYSSFWLILLSLALTEVTGVGYCTPFLCGFWVLSSGHPGTLPVELSPWPPTYANKS